jgi:hypothetical protein
MAKAATNEEAPVADPVTPDPLAVVGDDPVGVYDRAVAAVETVDRDVLTHVAVAAVRLFEAGVQSSDGAAVERLRSALFGV